jgi:ligand-binding sensor domain-containing protein
MKYIHLYIMFLMFVFYTSCKGQNQKNLPKDPIKVETKEVIISNAPSNIVRTIIQDKKGNIWMASWEGIIRYDGKLFTNITRKMTSARFFSVIEDRRGNFWFGTIGSGVFYYDGISFQNFTTEKGLLNNEVTSIYEDKKGNIWFGVSGGVSCFDGKSFRNYIIEGNTMAVDWIGIRFSERQPVGANSIIEDKNGNFWFATTKNTFLFDGKTFTVVSHEDKPLENIRTLMNDKKGDIWLAGADGLWQDTDGKLTNYTKQFVGYVIEDKKGNIWTSSENTEKRDWALSMYDGQTLFNKKPTVTQITKKQMTFGILEDSKGNIWFGDLKGVYRYDGKTITDFKNKEDQK